MGELQAGMNYSKHAGDQPLPREKSTILIKSYSSPPSARAQEINKILHAEPYSSIFRVFFWCSILVLVCPLGGAYLLLLTLMYFIRWMFLPILHISGFKSFDRIEEVKGGHELGVFITGCDTGFGRSASYLLAERGFVVFAGCLSEEGMQQFEAVPSIHPLKVDVTKDKDLYHALSIVSKWLEHSFSANERQRFLHAIVNNAGIGTAGLVDWTPLSSYELVMEVNYFGTIRSVKTFLPILKKQSSSGLYRHARIVNIVSMAGLGTMKGSSSYFSSKHAVEAFSTVLRAELLSFDIPVVTLNPSFHLTEMVDNIGRRFIQVWRNLSSDLRKEYGREYFIGMFRNTTESTMRTAWNADVVEDILVGCIEKEKPHQQVIIGSDAKFAMLLMRFLAPEIGETLKASIQKNVSPKKFLEIDEF